MGKGKQGGNSGSTEISASSNDTNTKGTISGNPDKILKETNSDDSKQPQMVQTALKLEEIDPLLSQQLGKLQQDCAQLSYKYMEVGSDFKKVGEMIGSYKNVIDQKMAMARKEKPPENKK